MKKFKVELTKTYMVEIFANDIDNARMFSEFFTSDSTNLAKKEDEIMYRFKIDSIECRINEAMQAAEINEYE